MSVKVSRAVLAQQTPKRLFTKGADSVLLRESPCPMQRHESAIYFVQAFAVFHGVHIFYSRSQTRGFAADSSLLSLGLFQHHLQYPQGHFICGHDGT